jgi:hypothetical protein
MAVAADLHRDFLIPDEALAPPTTENFPDDARLFFCVKQVCLKFLLLSISECKKQWQILKKIFEQCWLFIIEVLKLT